MGANSPSSGNIVKELFCPQFFLALVLSAGFGYLVVNPHPLVPEKESVIEEKKISPAEERAIGIDQSDIDLADLIAKSEPWQQILDGKPEWALETARRWGNSPERRAEIKDLLAAGSVLLGSIDEKDKWLGEVLFARALKIAPGSKKVSLYCADRYYQSGMLDEAEKLYLAVLPNLPDSDIIPRLKLARLYLVKEEPGKADKILRAVLANNPDDVQARQLSAIVLGQKARFDEGFKIYEQSVTDAFSQDRFSDPELAELVESNHGSPDSAMNELRRRMEASPLDMKSRAFLVHLLLKVERNPLAKAELDIGISKNSSHPLLHEGMLEYALRANNKSLAKEEFRKVAEFQPKMVSQTGGSRYTPSEDELTEQVKLDEQSDALLSS